MKRIVKISARYAAAGWILLLILNYGCNDQRNNSAYDKSNNDSNSVDEHAHYKVDPMRSEASAQLRLAMRKLWDDHVWWMRNVMLCLVDDLPGGEQATNRLLKNQDDIGDALKPYYGKDAGKQLTDLLYPHITIAAEVIKAAKADNKAALDNANARWFANADEISRFLSNANPENWELKEMEDMMHDHLNLTTDEVVKRIKKDYDGDIRAFEKVHAEIMEMADMLSEGIIRQFPERFSDEQFAKSDRVY